VALRTAVPPGCFCLRCSSSRCALLTRCRCQGLHVPESCLQIVPHTSSFCRISSDMQSMLAASSKTFMICTTLVAVICLLGPCSGVVCNGMMRRYSCSTAIQTRGAWVLYAPPVILCTRRGRVPAPIYVLDLCCACLHCGPALRCGVVLSLMSISFEMIRGNLGVVLRARLL
jgi:hypothetical protein